MKYVKAKAQVVMFDNSDVVTASALNDASITCEAAVAEGNWGNDPCGGYSQIFDTCKVSVSGS